MLVDHEFDFAKVVRIAQPSAQDRPEVVILGLMVADEFVAKLLPSLSDWRRNRLGALEARRDLLEPGRVAPQGLVDRPHKGDIRSRYFSRVSGP